MKVRQIKNDVIITMQASEYDSIMETLKCSEDYLAYQVYFKLQEAEE